MEEQVKIVIMQVGGDQAAATLKQLNEQIKGVGNSQRQAAPAAQSLASGFSNMTNVVRSFIALDLVRRIAGVGVSCVQAAAQMEMWRASFETMLGSAEAADRLIEQIREMGRETPFTTAQLVDASQTLLSFGMAAEDLLPTLQNLGDISLGDSAKLDRLALAFGQTRAAGKLMGQDLLQMISAGFNPLQEMSRTTGQSMSQLRAQMERGAISAQMVAEAFRTATAEGGRFHDGMARGAQTLTGQWSTFKDRIEEVGVSIGQRLNPVLSYALQNINGIFSRLDRGQGLMDSYFGQVESMARATGTWGTRIAEAISLLTRLHGVTRTENWGTGPTDVASILLSSRPQAGGGAGGGGAGGGRGTGGGGGGGGGPSASQQANEAYQQYYAPALAEMRDQMKADSTLFGQMVQIFDPEASAGEIEMYTQHTQGMIKVTEQFASGVNQIMSSLDSADKIRQQNKYNRYKLFINANIKDETERKAALQALDDYQEMRSAKIAYESAKRNKAIMLMNAIVNTAAGITSALAMSGPPWIGIAMAAIVGAMGAAQIGLISATPLPQAAEGALIKGSSAGTALIAGEGGRSEMIVPFENEEVMGRSGFGTTVVNLNIDNLYATDDVPQNMAMAIDRALYNLQRQRNSSFASAING